MLEALGDGTARHRLVRKEVRRADQRADLDSLRGQRRGKGGHHCRRKPIVDAASEQNMDRRRIDSLGQIVQEHLDHRVPEDKARSWTNVASALAALEDEPSRAIL